MIKNYEYGLLPPTQNAQLVEDQMRLGHRYYNALVEIERERRARVGEILVGHPDSEALAKKVADLAARRDAARTSIKAARQKTRDRSETEAMREGVKSLGAELKAARAELKAAKALVSDDPMIRRAIDVADDRAAARVRAARASCNCYWSTYLLSEQAMDAAKKSKTPPQFRRWTGDGRVSVQLQGGLDLDDLWGNDTQLVIRPVDPIAHDPGARRGERRLANRTVVRMRVQSTDKGKPVWAEWPMILHRAIPEGSRVKVATISKRRRDCRTWDWRLLLTLDIPDGAINARPVPADGAVALNLGWCAAGEGNVRAGYIVGTDGLHREVTVPASVIDRVEKSDSIRSIRDKNLDAMRAQLVAWMREHEDDLPSWLVERTILSKGRPSTGGVQVGAAPGPTTGDGLGNAQEQLGASRAETSGNRAAPGPTTGDALGNVSEQLGAPRAETIANTSLRVAPGPTTGDGGTAPSREQLDASRVETAGSTRTEGSAKPHDLATTSASTDSTEGSAGPHDAATNAPIHMIRNWHVGQWRSASRFRALAFAWRAARFAGDGDGYAIIESWRYRDEHLERYESGMRRGGLLNRREGYRILAAELAGRYRTLLIDDFDLRRFQESPKPEDARVEYASAKRNQRHAAGSELRQALVNAFGPARIVKDRSVDVTRQCHACLTIEERSEKREHSCASCGATWDQDANACLNLIRRWQDGGSGGGKIEEKKESRTERMLRAKKEKKEDARDAVPGSTGKPLADRQHGDELGEFGQDGAEEGAALAEVVA